MKTHAGITSAELARVREVTNHRRFVVGDDSTDVESRVTYFVATDSLVCHAHQASDDCTCTARVRLCGILTHSETTMDAAKFAVVHDAGA